MTDSSRRNDAVRDKEERSEPTPLLFAEFPAGEEIAQKLIREYHPDLATARIRYVCRNKAARSGGLPVPGKVYKMTGKFEYLTECDFVLEIALEVWNDLQPKQRTALMDHLLSRCVGEEDEKTGEYKWRVRPPEVQEFPDVAARHGKWHEGLARIEESLRRPR